MNPKAILRKAKEEGRDPDELVRSIMAHEIDHVVQAEEMLPSGSNVSWIEDQIKDLSKSRTKLDRYKRILAANTAKPSKIAEAKEAVPKLEKHIQFFERFKVEDAGKIYTQTLGEADAFWTGAMHLDPNVSSKVPPHYDQTQGVQLLDIKDGKPQTSSFNPDESLITSSYDKYGRGIKE